MHAPAFAAEIAAPIVTVQATTKGQEESVLVGMAYYVWIGGMRV